MPQKIFDIIPKKEDKKEIIIKSKTEKKEKIDFKKYILYFFAASFLLLGLWSYFSFSTAEIEIWLETENFSFEDFIVVDPKIDYINVVDRIIPGKIFSGSEPSVQSFASSGKTKAEEKSKGTIRVYNNYGTEDQSLLPETRFVSKDGKLFRSLKREIVPGGKYIDGKLEPGYVDIEVRAAESGEEYNIDSTTFSIPGFAGTSKYTAFYGKSFSPMEGGYKGEAPLVLEEDIEKAKKISEEKTLREGYNLARKDAESEGFILLGEQSLFSKEILKEEISDSAGDLKDSFSYEIEIFSKFLGFKKTDIDALAMDMINNNIPGGKKIKENSLSINYEFIGTDKDGKMAFNVKYTLEFYSNINYTEIHNLILGEKREEIKLYLENMPEIKRVRINSWPLFRSTAPKQQDKTKIKVNI